MIIILIVSEEGWGWEFRGGGRGSSNSQTEEEEKEKPRRSRYIIGEFKYKYCYYLGLPRVWLYHLIPVQYLYLSQYDMFTHNCIDVMLRSVCEYYYYYYGYCHREPDGSLGFLTIWKILIDTSYRVHPPVFQYTLPRMRLVTFSLSHSISRPPYRSLLTLHFAHTETWSDVFLCISGINQTFVFSIKSWRGAGDTRFWKEEEEKEKIQRWFRITNNYIW